MLSLAITDDSLRITEAIDHSFRRVVVPDNNNSNGHLHRPLWHCHVQRVQNNIWILLWSIVFARPPHANGLLTTRGHRRGLWHKLPASARYVHPVRLCRRTAAVRGRGIVLLDSHRLRDGRGRGRGSHCRGGSGSLRVRVHLCEFVLCVRPARGNQSPTRVCDDDWRWWKITASAKFSNSKLVVLERESERGDNEYCRAILIVDISMEAFFN